ncbi:MAG: hypothetical protein WCO94_17105 [Verrucomicrobiota bacterium]
MDRKSLSRWKWWTAQAVEDVDDAFGKGKRVVLTFSKSPHPAVPTYIFTYPLHEGDGVFNLPPVPRTGPHNAWGSLKTKPVPVK